MQQLCWACNNKSGPCHCQHSSSAATSVAAAAAATRKHVPWCGDTGITTAAACSAPAYALRCAACHASVASRHTGTHTGVLNKTFKGACCADHDHSNMHASLLRLARLLLAVLCAASLLPSCNPCLLPCCCQVRVCSWKNKIPPTALMHTTTNCSKAVLSRPHTRCCAASKVYLCLLASRRQQSCTRGCENRQRQS